MANRNSHPGVAYGPVRPSGPPDRGRIVGNLLGLLVVAIAAGLLVFGIYVFIQSRGAEATQSPSTTFQAFYSSPSPSSTAGSIGSPESTSAPTGGATDGITPPPTLYVPSVVSGPGYITFGTNVDANLHITDAKTTFAVDEPMVWTADLTQPANSTDLKILIYKQDARQPNGQKLVQTDSVKPDATGAQVYFRRLRPIGATLGTGLFTVQYVRGHDILATGSFLVQ